MNDEYSHLKPTESLLECTKKIDDEAEADNKTDTCDICKKEFKWKELSWVGSTSCRICSDPECSRTMQESWEKTCREVAEEYRTKYDEYE